jgi:DNA-binding GntR family transcriptional regulator
VFAVGGEHSLETGQIHSGLRHQGGQPGGLDGEREQHIASLRFHALLAEQAENDLLGFLIGFMANTLSDLTVYRRLYSPPNMESWTKGKDYQERLMEALRHGDAPAARQIITDHMSTAQALMEVHNSPLFRGLNSRR